MKLSSVWSHVWAVVRMAVALLSMVAIITPAAVVVRGAIEGGRHVPTVAANFLSFFTMTFNFAGAVVLLWAAIWLWSKRGDAVEPPLLTIALATVTTCVLVTGAVYNFQLPGMSIARVAIVPWSNVVLHVVTPLFFLVDLLIAPRRRALPWRALLAVLVFPAAWTAYTLIRANLVTNTLTGVPYWYPYPFLNPYLPGGYGRVTLYVLAITVVVVVTACLVIWVGRLRQRFREARMRRSALPERVVERAQPRTAESRGTLGAATPETREPVA